MYRNKTISIQNLEVVSIDEKGITLVKRRTWSHRWLVAITDAKKKVLPPHAPFPIDQKTKSSEVT